MTGAEIMAVVGFFIALATFAFGIWKYVDSKLGAVRTDATTAASSAAAVAHLAREEVAAHRLHVAETYITKAGMREATEQIMDAISAVKSSIDGTNQRIDRLYEQKPAARRST